MGIRDKLYITEFQCKAIDILLTVNGMSSYDFACKAWYSRSATASASRWAEPRLKGFGHLRKLELIGLIYKKRTGRYGEYLWYVTELGILSQHNYLAHYGDYHDKKEGGKLHKRQHRDAELSRQHPTQRFAVHRGHR